jgi:hypothetical protein
MAEVTLTLEEYETLRDLAMGVADRVIEEVVVAPVKRKVSAASKRYGRAFKEIAPDFKKTNGSWKKNGFRNAVRAAHKLAKKN